MQKIRKKVSIYKIPLKNFHQPRYFSILKILKISFIVLYVEDVLGGIVVKYLVIDQ